MNARVISAARSSERTPRAPVRSLAEILDKGVYLKALEQPFQRSNDVTTLDSEEYKAAAARQAALLERLLRARSTISA